MREDTSGREKRLTVVAREHGVSRQTVSWILKKNQVEPFEITENL